MPTRTTTTTALIALLLASAAVAQTGPTQPYDVNQARGQLEAELRRLNDDFARKIPKEAYKTTKVDGKEVRRLDTKHPEYRKLRDQWRQKTDAAHQRFNKADGVRWKQMQRISKRAGLDIGDGKAIQNTGSVPEKVGSDLDLTAGNDKAARKLVDALRGEGHRVVELPDRYVDHTHDATIWKRRPQMKVGSAEWKALVEAGAVFNSDKFSTAGGQHYTSKGQIGVRDPHGAVIDNLKKLSDSGLTGVNQHKGKIDWNTAAKSVYKASKISGVKLDPALQTKVDALYGQRKTLTEVLDLAGKPKAQQLREVRALKKQLLDVARESSIRARQRSITIDKTRQGLVDNLEARAAKAKNPATRQQLKRTARNIRQRIAEAKITRKITRDALVQRDPVLNKELGKADIKAQQRWEQRHRETQARAAEIAKARQPGKMTQAVGAAKKWGARAMTGLWIVHAGLTAADKEMEDALREGRPPSKLRAVGNAVLEGLLIAPTIGSVNQGLALRDKRLEEYDRKYPNHWGIEARAVAMWDAVKTISCYDLGLRIGNEELDAEMRRALAEGEDMSRWRFMGNAGVRVLGELTMINSICRSATRDWAAEARWHQTERALRNKVAARCWSTEKQLEAIRADALWWKAHFPGHARVGELEALFQNKAKRLHDLAKRLRIRRGADDPMVQRLYDALKRQGLRGGRISVWHRRKSWYCTNRPQIQVGFAPDPIVRGGGMPRPTRGQLASSTRAMAGRWRDAGYDADALGGAVAPVSDRVRQLPPEQLGKLSWPGKPERPAEGADAEALAAYRERLQGSLDAWWLGALTMRDPKIAAAALAKIHAAAGVTPSADAAKLLERLRRDAAAR